MPTLDTSSGIDVKHVVDIVALITVRCLSIGVELHREGLASQRGVTCETAVCREGGFGP